MYRRVEGAMKTGWITAAFGCLMLAALLTVQACTSRCGGSEQQKYVCEFDRRMDTLVERMQNASGTQRVDQDILINGLLLEQQTDILNIALVGPAAEAVLTHFDNVPLLLAMEIAASGADAWGAEVKTAVARQHERLTQEVARLAADIRRNPDGYQWDPMRLPRTPDQVFGIRHYGFADDRLYVEFEGAQYFLGALLDFDLDAWLEAVAATSRSVAPAE
jgi:hypothetical protein